MYYGVSKNYIYLYGLTEFEVVSDHMPPLNLYNKHQETMPPRVANHKIMLQGYNYRVTYQKGKDNPADYMSRHPIYGEEADNRDMEIDIEALIRMDLPTAITVEELKQATKVSQEMLELEAAINRGYIEKHQDNLQPYKKMLEEITVMGGVIMRGERIVVPMSLRKKVVTVAHEAHPGMVRTKQLIKETMWFPNITKWVEEEVRECLACQAVNHDSTQEPVKTSVLPEQAWSQLVTDFYGPLPTGEYLLVVQDMYSRYPVM